MSLQQRFCDRARQRRDEMGWTQSKLAGQIGVTQPTISNWERGLHDMSLDDAAAIAQALGLKLTEMLS